METETFAFIGAIVFSLGYFVYLIEMLRGNCEPTRASWLVWASVNLLALLAMAYEGKANPLAWLVGIISPIIFLLSLYFGKPGWSLIDKVCATLAFVGLLLWFVVTAEYTILTIIVINILGIVPTIISALEDPRRESKLAWFVAFVALVIAVIGFKEWSLVAVGQTLVFLLLNAVMNVLLHIRKPPQKE